jgi:hypothetical protein
MACNGGNDCETRADLARIRIGSIRWPIPTGARVRHIANAIHTANDEIVARVFVSADPTADTMAAYRRARELTEEYWRLISNDSRVSTDFREIAAACGSTLNALPRIGAYAYQATP